MLTIVFPLLAALTSGPCEEFCNAEAARHYARLNAAAALTRRDSERAAFLIRGNDGRLHAIPWQPGDAIEASHKGPIPARQGP